MHYVTSDLHGYPLRGFLRLLEKARFSDADSLTVLGDVIDRNGEGGVAMLQWLLRQANARLILGNHEGMLLSCRFLFDADLEEGLSQFDPEEIRMLSVWMRNGASPTIKSLRELFHADEEAGRAILEYLEKAPLYEETRVSDRRYLLTHSGLSHFRPEKRLFEYERDDFLWNRPRLEDSYYPNITVIFGHTPTWYYGEEYADKMLKTDTWIDIDTGAAGGGKPMLLRLEDEQPFYVDS